ncbi:hypothetical protein [Streptomyces lasiicapitis]|uniref:Uncharacterized protein n=1 Tax=Streptomyces lasiicapitis TaxID=1923961 RepID=A0ABQ2MVQ8_9ACTN|nr:hypothetical protein [Streptomyces lasiicapitis]GGO58779.1 hypothetical protein GCM10012286_78850 [Streptomyces lasiicapitis]
MGYDMYSETGPDEQQSAAIREASTRVEELRCQYMNARSADAAKAMEGELDAAWEEFEKSRTGLYFRLNIWGMGTARQIMGALDMLTDVPFPDWPTLEAYGLTDHPDEPDYYTEGPERDAAQARLTDQERAYLDAVRAVRDRDAETPGIPAYKLTSNDGWLVTEREVKAALDVWEKADLKDQNETQAEFPWWGEWLDFLKYNAERGGFRVH